MRFDFSPAMRPFQPDLCTDTNHDAGVAKRRVRERIVRSLFLPPLRRIRSFLTPFVNAQGTDREKQGNPGIGPKLVSGIGSPLYQHPFRHPLLDFFPIRASRRRKTVIPASFPKGSALDTRGGRFIIRRSHEHPLFLTGREGPWSRNPRHDSHRFDCLPSPA